MKIELRRITHSAALSQETAAYRAEIWIDGELAFHAHNQGHGSADFFDKVGRWDESEVQAWLKANRPPRALGDTTIDHDLEWEVSDLLTYALEGRRLKRLLRTNLVTIEKNQIFQYPLRKRPLANISRAVLATNPDAVIVNGAADDVFEHALDLLISSH